MYALTIDGQGFFLDETGTLTGNDRVSLRPDDTSRLRVEFCEDDAIAALTEAGFEFDDTRDDCPA